MSLPTCAGNYLFYAKPSIQSDSHLVYRRASLADDELLVLNLDQEDGSAERVLGGWTPSPDGKLLLYSTTIGGSEDITLHLFDMEKGCSLDDYIPHLASNVAWSSESQGFYYARYPDTGDVADGIPFQHSLVYYHRVGQPYQADLLLFGEDRPPHEYKEPIISEDGRWLFILTYTDNGNSLSIYVKPMGEDGSSFRLLVQNSKPTPVFSIQGDQVCLVSHFDGHVPQLWCMDINSGQRWVVLPYRHNVEVMSGWVDGQRLILVEQVSGDGQELAIYDLKNLSQRRLVDLKQSPLAKSSSQIVCDGEGDDLYIGLNPIKSGLFAEVYHYELNTGQLTEWFKANPRPSSIPRQSKCHSQDGAEVYFDLYSEDGYKPNQPIILYVYGGFGLPTNEPEFMRTWIERGGTLVVAKVRGGGDQDEAWHLAGKGQHKQRAIDDLIAVADWLTFSGQTSTDRLVLWGGSNGGLLVAAAVAARPDLCRVAVCMVPLTDMLRYHRYGKGSYMIDEYGDPDLVADFNSLLAYSPYHNVQQDKAYPAMVFTAGSNDVRTHPMHARKMVAALQAASSSGLPVLLLEDGNAGHSRSSAAEQGEKVDIFSFIYDQVGLGLGLRHSSWC